MPLQLLQDEPKACLHFALGSTGAVSESVLELGKPKDHPGQMCVLGVEPKVGTLLSTLFP